MNEVVCANCKQLNDEFDLECDATRCSRCGWLYAQRVDDAVNHPGHYTDGSIECIDAIEAALTPEEFRGYCKGNALKYVWRERLKGGNESLAKAGWYLYRVRK